MDDKTTGFDQITGFDALDSQGLRPGEIHAWISPPPPPASGFCKFDLLVNPYYLGEDAFKALASKFHVGIKKHRSIDDPWEDSSQ